MTSIPAFNTASSTTATLAPATPQAAQPSSADVASAQARLDAPDPTYPALSALHVGLLQAMGTPAATIAEIAARKPDPAWLDSYIQNEIMQNPEGWDTYVHNQPGTARAGILKVIPNAVLPAPGAGVGSMPSDSSRIPGITTPLLDPSATPTYSKSSDTEKLVRNVVWGSVAVGVGLLAWKLVKGHGAAAIAKDGVAALGGGGGGAAKAGFASGVRNMFRGGGAKATSQMFAMAADGGTIAAGGNIASIGMSQTARTARHMLEVAVRTDNAAMFKQAVGLGALVEGGPEFAATAMSIVSGTGAMNGRVAAAGFASIALNMPVEKAAQIALDALRVEGSHAAAAAAPAAAAAGEGAATQLVGVMQRILS